MFSLAMVNDRLFAQDKTVRIVYRLVVRNIPVPESVATGG